MSLFLMLREWFTDPFGVVAYQAKLEQQWLLLVAEEHRQNLEAFVAAYDDHRAKQVAAAVETARSAFFRDRMIG